MSNKEALWRAASAGNVTAVLAAVSSGGNVNARAGAYADTPLLIAASHGHAACVQALLDAGADPDALDGVYQAPAIFWAAQEGHLDVLLALIDGGADVDTVDALEISALEVAAEAENGANARYADNMGDTALHFATVTVGAQSVRIARELIAEGANVDAASSDGTTPLMWAAEFGNVRVWRLLVGQGADLEAMDGWGMTAREKVCQCLESAGREHLLQCPEVGCRDGNVEEVAGMLDAL
eukprot:evm.model.scf_332.2 EVM.evm.TU.scf_332.2   scf_332:32601-33461(-)